MEGGRGGIVLYNPQVTRVKVRLMRIASSYSSQQNPSGENMFQGVQPLHVPDSRSELEIRHETCLQLRRRVSPLIDIKITY